MPDLKPFQKEGVKFLVSRKAALLADEQGLGKTVQAIEAINELKAKKILIVGPAVAKLNWEKELRVWLKEKLNVQVLNGRSDKIKWNSDVLIANYDILISGPIFTQITALRFAVGIFDESHYLKNRSAKRTKAVLLKTAIASKCVYRWFLSGTPILNRPVELYPILKSMAPQVIDPYLTFDSYARHFCDAYFDGFQLVAKGASHIDELANRLHASGFMLRRLKKDVLKELPPKQYQIVVIPPKNAAIKNLIKQEFTFSRGDVNHVKVGADGAELAIIRHELALSKVDTALEHIEDVLEATQKVFIIAYHRDVIAKLEKGLAAYNPVVVTGDTKNRVALQDKFQEDINCRVFLGQIQAAGVNLTLTAASTVIFVESSWVPGEIDQAADRCHRIGQKDSVLVQFLVISESLEEQQLRTVVDKKQIIESIMEDDADVAALFT